MNIRVKITRDGSGLIRTLDLEEYLRGVVPAEVYAAWPLEALKAQAVTARTYAIKKIKDRKNETFDVDDTSLYQAYVPSKIDSCTDKAIQETTNLYMEYGGEPIDAVYSDSNGGYAMSAEERWGTKVPYLQEQYDPYTRESGMPRNGHGVGFSQWGAFVMAQKGFPYTEILKFYYKGITIVGEEIMADFRINQCILVENDCYKAAAPITPCGVMVHSTGANNKMLKRYLAPDDGIIGVNQYGNHWNQNSEKMGRLVCVHAFIGEGVDGNVYTYQTLPWTLRGWHSASGPNGSANKMGYIGFEICEDGLVDKNYFDAIWEQATKLTAYLCERFKLNPSKDGVIIGHYEGYARGIASNHGDPKPWFTKFGKSMDAFRSEVGRLLGQETDSTTLRRGDVGALVRELQQKLLRLNYELPKYGADGDFGAETESAVKALQKDKGLVIDGVVGPKTWALIEENLKKPTLRKGDKGPFVKEAQLKLMALGYPLPKWGADSSFGDETLKAIQKFQKDNKLSIDGVIGPKTWEVLDKI